jgi:hypothetical protein
MYWLIKAEQMSFQKLQSVVNNIEDQGLVDIVGGGMDSVFTGFSNLIISGSSDAAKEVQNMIWSVNGGAYCECLYREEDDIEDYL